ncbi:ROK family protein [Pseudonocardia sp. TRM90224]|uniref:ROK family protein n=1 Tax=Pseudonocardia sp. TRM90224 TaxID=2812678 RepID=UPI001E3795D6|nr:ROK family protein [Pseudonocardia sp. TRM90224]
MIPSTAADLRRAGLVRALRAVHEAGGEISRAELARTLDCTRATAAALVTDLADIGLLTERPSLPTGRRGRPTPLVTPVPDGPVVAVAEVGVDGVRVATSGIGGRLSAIHSIPLPDHAVEAVAAVVRGALDRRLSDLGARCRGVGIGVFGLVDHTSRTIVEAPNLGWTDVDLLGMLGLPEHLPVRMGNVANLIALADSVRGIGHGRSTVLHIHAGVGVGGALVVDGRPMPGRSGLAGEYGHLPFGTTAELCRCGARGCWETEVDQLALARAAGVAADAATAAAAVRRIIKGARAGDAAAVAATRQVGVALGRGIGAVVNVHDPDLVVLAGHAAQLHTLLPDVVERAAAAAALRAHRRRMPPIASTPIGGDAALIGAAEQLFVELLSDPWSLATR